MQRLEDEHKTAADEGERKAISFEPSASSVVAKMAGLCQGRGFSSQRRKRSSVARKKTAQRASLRADIQRTANLWPGWSAKRGAPMKGGQREGSWASFEKRRSASM
jgi:hypothetical protein